MPDQTQHIQEILDAVMEEVDARLETPLWRKDRIAVTSAIGKASFRALLRGAAETAGMVNDDWAALRGRLAEFVLPELELPEQIAHVNLTVQEPDLWAEKYGNSGTEAE